MIPEYDKDAWTIPVMPDTTERTRAIQGIVSTSFERAKQRFNAEIDKTQQSIATHRETQPERHNATWTPTLYHRRSSTQTHVVVTTIDLYLQEDAQTTCSLCSGADSVTERSTYTEYLTT